MAVLRSKLGAVTATAAIGALAAAGVSSAALAADEEAIEAGITVPKVEGLVGDFMNGVDASSILSLEESGVTFQDFEGDEADVFAVMAEAGVNYSRIRVWNDPYDAEGRGYGGGTVDAERATEIGLRSTEAGMKVFVDFHYADFWAHPGQQPAPKAWEHMSVDQKADALYDYTVETLTAMADAGVDIGMVQVGNETTGLELADVAWPASGALFKAGADAVRDALGDDVKVAIHFTNPERGTYMGYAEQLDKGPDGVADTGDEIDYDVFASSYYAYWHGTLANLTSQLSNVASTYGKDVIVAETSWNYTLEDGDGHTNTIRATTASDKYSSTVQGQALAIRDVIDAVAQVGDAGLGVFYWEPAWIPVGTPDELEANKLLWEEFGSGWAASYAGEYDPDDAGVWFGGSAWDNQAMFDFEGHPLESLRVFDYVTTGSVAPREVDSVQRPAITVTDGDAIMLPSAVAVSFTDGTTETEAVTWAARASWITGRGVYEITGTTTGGYETTATVTVRDAGGAGENILVNPGFEDGKDPWVTTGTGVTIPSASDVIEGDYAAHFYSGADFAFTVSQTLENVPAGDYVLTASVHGEALGSDDSATLTLASGIASQSADLSLNGWQNYDSPSTAVVSVIDGARVTVSAQFDLGAGSWGAIDSFSLIAENPMPVADTAALESLLDDATGLDRDGATSGSLAILDNAIARGTFILAATAPSQDSVDAAADALHSAIGLVAAGGDVPDPTVVPVELSLRLGDAVTLPATVTVVAYDDTTATESVEWNDVLDLISSPGSYTVTGATENGWLATATVVVSENALGNGGFENGTEDVSPWTIAAGDTWPTEEQGTAAVVPQGDIEGDFALNGWAESSENGGYPFWLSARQTTAPLPAGTYRLQGTATGGSSADPATTYQLGAWSAAGVDDAVALGLDGWGVLDTESLEFTLTEAAPVDVWISADLVPGDWSYVDDISLVRIDAPTVANTDALLAGIASAEAIVREDYTATSLKVVDLALERARIVAASSRADQTTVDAATAALADAIDALVEAADPVTPDPEPTTDPDPSTDPEPSADPELSQEPGSTVNPMIEIGGFEPGQVPTLSPGDEITLRLTGMPVDWVEVGIASTYQRLASADLVDGAAIVSVTIPADMEAGTHHLQVCDADGAVLVSYEVEIAAEPNPGGLSGTGPDSTLTAALILLSLGLAAAGAALAVRARRTHR